MSEIQVWPFLVSRNQFLDYRTVVAPDFLCEAKIAGLLAKVAEGDPDNIYYREIFSSKVGDLTIVYRIIEALAKDISSENEGILKDSFGREIYLIEGVVLKEIQSSPALGLENLNFIHHQLINYYCEFWEWITPQSAFASEKTILEIKGDSLNYKRLAEYVVNPVISNSEKSIKNNISQSRQLSLIDKFGFNGEIYFLKFLDSSNLLIHQYDKEVVRLDVKTDERKILIKGNWNLYIRQVTVDTDSKLLCTSSIVRGDRNIVKIFDLNNSTEKEIGENAVSELGRINALAFSYSGEVVAFDEKNKLSKSVPIKLVDTKGGGIRNTLKWHTSDIKCIESSPFDDVFASGDGQGFVRLWNWKTLTRLGDLAPRGLPVNALAFSPTEKILISGGDDGKIKIIDYETSIVDRGFLHDENSSADWGGGVNTLAFSPDGKTVASGGDDCNVKLWDIKSKKLINEFLGHDQSVMSISFSPNGRLLASGSKDKTVRIWQLD